MPCWRLPFYSSLASLDLEPHVNGMVVVIDAMFKGLAVVMHLYIYMCITLLHIAPLHNETKEKVCSEDVSWNARFCRAKFGETT